MDADPPITDAEGIARELQRRLMARPLPGRVYRFRPCLPRVQCVDGFSVSVQANEASYCSPRENEGPWDKVELGYPTAPMPSLAKYCDSSEEAAPTATDTVWGYVPLSEVAAILADHGGLLPEVAA
jgi:hypothetical protein